MYQKPLVNKELTMLVLSEHTTGVQEEKER